MAKTIALAVENFSRHGGGAEGYGADLAAFLIRSGWQVHLIGLTWDGYPDGAVFHQLQIPARLPAWTRLLAFARAHRHLVEASDFDVVLGFGNTTVMNVYQSHGGVHRISSEAKVWTETSAWRRAVKRLLMRLSIKHHVRRWIESAPFRANPRPVIVAIAGMIRDDFSAEFGVPKQEIELVWNGIDPGRFGRQALDGRQGRIRERYGINDDETIFLFISFDLKKKGLTALMEAAGLLRQRTGEPFRVLVVGGTPDRSQLRRCGQMGLEETVIFTGPTTEVEDFYADSDVFVLPTFYDACSLVVIEAMAAGLPPVTTETNGAAGLIENGRTGLIISHPPAGTELAKAMAELLDPACRTAMARRAETAASSMTTAKNHHQLLEIFDRLAAEHPSAI